MCLTVVRDNVWPHRKEIGPQACSCLVGLSITLCFSYELFVDLISKYYNKMPFIEDQFVVQNTVIINMAPLFQILPLPTAKTNPPLNERL